MIKSIAVDDEPPALRIIDNYCKKIDFLILEKCFTNTEQAMRHLKKYNTDLLFLDIKMPLMSGLELYSQLDYKPAVIFTTAHSKYAIEGFELDAIDYLLKPFSFDRFEKAVMKFKNYVDLQNKQTEKKVIYVRYNYNLLPIETKDILFISGLDDYVQIHFTDKYPIQIKTTLKNIMEILPSLDFVRVHKSYIVNVKKIILIKSKNIEIGTHTIPIGSSYENELEKILKQNNEK